MIGNNKIILCEAQLLSILKEYFEERLDSTPISIYENDKGDGTFEIVLGEIKK